MLNESASDEALMRPPNGQPSLRCRFVAAREGQTGPSDTAAERRNGASFPFASCERLLRVSGQEKDQSRLNYSASLPEWSCQLARCQFASCPLLGPELI